MFTNKKTFYFNKFVNSTSLATREIAREVCEEIEKMSAKQIILDFSNIEYASRSFFDELNNRLDNIIRHKKVEIIHLNKNLNVLYQLVRTPKTKLNTHRLSISKVKVLAI